MLNVERLLGQLLSGGVRRGLGRGRRGRRGGSLLGGLSAGTKAQIGMGLLGVAMAAYEHYTKQNESPAAPAPTGSGARRAIPSTPEAGSNASQASTDATLLVQAMVAAAAADGVIDAEERAQILERSDQAGFDAETKAFLERELENPKSLAVILASARPELAVDLYAASYAAIDLDTEAERTYLDNLAKHLNLTDEVRQDIHQKLESA